MWSETSGEWTKRERRSTHGLSHSVTTWCVWELAAAGSVMCHHQCQWFILWPEQLLLCKRGKQIASSCAISALGNCYYCAVVDALTRTSINTSLTPRSTEQEDESRESNTTKSIYQNEAPENHFLHCIPMLKFQSVCEAFAFRRIIPIPQKDKGCLHWLCDPSGDSVSWPRTNILGKAEENMSLFWISPHNSCVRNDKVWNSTHHGPWISALALMQASQAGMTSRRMPLLLLVVLAEVLSGVCVPGDGSGKYKGSWRWKGDRSRE